MAEQGEGRKNAHTGELTRTERLLSRLIGIIGVADVMALLMVLVTAFSAIATWRTADIYDAIYRASEQPYFGVQDVRMDRGDKSDPRIVVQYANVGHVQAFDLAIRRVLRLDGHEIPGQTKTLHAGVLSQQVTHLWYSHLPSDAYGAVENGRSQLTVEIKASYTGPRGLHHCYLERFAFDKDANNFDPAGGTARCEDRNE
ncbi:MAG: hypothetical protein WA005_05980 [Candidatus Binataceae bacterium]